MDAYSNLIHQIDAFIRKYYKNKFLKGILLVTGFLLFSLLLISSVEYLGRLNTYVRALLFFSFVGVNIYLLVFYVIQPLLKYYSFGKRITHEQASVIIGSFFPEISDRLLNTLQLKDELNVSNGQYDLIKASIEQRSSKLVLVPILSGINLRKNLVYLKYVLPVFFLFIAVALFFPNVFKQGTKRVVNYNKVYVEDAPFTFNVVRFSNAITEGESLEIRVKTKGDMIPDKVYLLSSEGRYLMQKDSKLEHSFILTTVSRNVTFNFEGNGYRSKTFFVSVKPQSKVVQFDAFLSFPTYLKKKNEAVKNVADLEVPEGTKISWKVATQNTSKITFQWDKKRDVFTEQKFTFFKQFFTSEKLIFLVQNNTLNKIDSSQFFISVLKDNFPKISVSEKIDSLSNSVRFFEGTMEDDYGLKSLYFVYTIHPKDGKPKTKKIAFLNPKGTQLNFTYAIDFRRENLDLNDRVDYYFQVFDNDGINGPKYTNSDVHHLRIPSLDKINDMRDEKQNEVKKDIERLTEKTLKFEKNIQKLRKELLNSNSNDWNKLQQVQQLKEQQKTISKELNQIQMQLNESLEEKNSLSELDKDIVEKQELIQDLLDKVMDQELKDLLDKLEQLLRSEDKEKVDEKVQNLERKSEDMQKQLDRSLEMLKKLQVNEKMDAIEKELIELSKQQIELKNDLEKDKISKENSLKKQAEINSKFDQIKEDLNTLKNLNEKLNSPLDFDLQKDTENSISEELKNAKENLSKGNENKAGNSQKKAASEMKEMASNLDDSQKKANAKQKGEDIESIRLLLENLVAISFAQESILVGFNKVKTTDPYYRKLGRDHRALMDDFKLVEDSLNMLAMRQPKVASFIDKELSEIRSNFDAATENIDEHQKGAINVHLQYVLTGVNNLSLLLNESLQKMQAEMQQEGSGNGSCSKPGKPGSKGSPMDMKEMLKKQLESLEKAKSKGSKPGEGLGSGLNGKEIAKMVAEQRLLRQKLEEMRNQMNKEGQGKGNSLNPLIRELVNQEKDLLNRNFKSNYIQRQKDIITRLLESEDAIRERGFDEKRESKSGKNYKIGNQILINQYKEQRVKHIDVLKRNVPEYTPYYKNKTENYFNEVL